MNYFAEIDEIVLDMCMDVGARSMSVSEFLELIVKRINASINARVSSTSTVRASKTRALLNA